MTTIEQVQDELNRAVWSAEAANDRHDLDAYGAARDRVCELRAALATLTAAGLVALAAVEVAS